MNGTPKAAPVRPDSFADQAGPITVSAARRPWLDLALVTLFVLLITLPFLWQPFNVDDHVSLDFAANQRQNPFQLHVDEYYLLGIDRTEWRDTNPPVLHMYLALVTVLTGSDSEPVLHLGYLLFPLVAAFSMYYLARRFTGHPLLATLLLLATPAFMTNAHMLMGDLSMTALSMAATALYIHGVDRNSNRYLALSSMLAMLAIFTSYQALALLGLLPLYALLRGKLGGRTILPLALPVVAFAAFTAFNLVRYESLPRFSHTRGLGLTPGHLWDRFQGALLRIGGATVFPPFMFSVFALRSKRLPVALLALSLSALAAVYQCLARGMAVQSAILYWLFMAAASLVFIAVIIDLAREGYGRLSGSRAQPGLAYLHLWLLLVLAAIITLLPHATVKYYLPVLPPLVLLLVRELESSSLPRRTFMALVITGIALTLASGFLISAADYRYGQSYRDFATGVSDRYAGDSEVWFVGEWGLRYYMEQEGYRYLTTASTEPAAGDIIITPYLMGWPLAPELLDRMELIDTVTDNWGLPLRLMNYDASAGYYGSHWGALPYTFTSQPVETFRVYRVGTP